MLQPAAAKVLAYGVLLTSCPCAGVAMPQSWDGLQQAAPAPSPSKGELTPLYPLVQAELAPVVRPTSDVGEQCLGTDPVGPCACVADLTANTLPVRGGHFLQDFQEQGATHSAAHVH